MNQDQDIEKLKLEKEILELKLKLMELEGRKTVQYPSPIIIDGTTTVVATGGIFWRDASGGTTNHWKTVTVS